MLSSNPTQAFMDRGPEHLNILSGLLLVHPDSNSRLSYQGESVNLDRDNDNLESQVLIVKVVHNIVTIVLNIPRAAPFTAKNKLRS